MKAFSSSFDDCIAPHRGQDHSSALAEPFTCYQQWLANGSISARAGAVGSLSCQGKSAVSIEGGEGGFRFNIGHWQF